MSDLVYSSDRGDLRPQSKQGAKLKSKQSTTSSMPPGMKLDGIIRIRLETKGKGGKAVTTMYGFQESSAKLDDLLRDLKQKTGTGGNRSGKILSLQGDKREILKQTLESLGYRVKIV